MREKLLEYIVCPKCQISFELSIAKQDEGHIMEGVLHCKNCGANYGIKEGIPVILDDQRIDEKNRIEQHPKDSVINGNPLILSM